MNSKEAAYYKDYNRSCSVDVSTQSLLTLRPVKMTCALDPAFALMS